MRRRPRVALNDNETAHGSGDRPSEGDKVLEAEVRIRAANCFECSFLFLPCFDCALSRTFVRHVTRSDRAARSTPALWPT